MHQEYSGRGVVWGSGSQNCLRQNVRGLPSRYNGGLKIVFVQRGSAAARHGLRNGDVLVGLDGYEMLIPQNLAFILDKTRLKKTETLSFQIIRNGSQALIGSISLVSKTRTVVKPRKSARR